MNNLLIYHTNSLMSYLLKVMLMHLLLMSSENGCRLVHRTVCVQRVGAAIICSSAVLETKLWGVARRLDKTEWPFVSECVIFTFIFQF